MASNPRQRAAQAKIGATLLGNMLGTEIDEDTYDAFTSTDDDQGEILTEIAERDQLLYNALVEKGFTEEQAVRILIAHIHQAK